MSIRPALASDLPGLVALTADCVACMRSHGIEQWDEVYPNEQVMTKDIVAGTLHVWCEGGGVIGCLTVDDEADRLWKPLVWSAEGEPFAAVHRLMIQPVSQGRGLARQLMAHAEAIARARGCRSIRLDTFTNNPAALALYEKLGYRRTGIALMRKGEFVGFEKLLK